MSESDSFLDEVTEEVRRDRLLKVLRRYAVWIGAGVVLLVGGIGVNEYLKNKAETDAQARGDAMLAALTEEDAAAREAGLQALVAEGGQAEVLARLQLAAVQATEGKTADAATTLESVATNTDTPQIFADLARLKIVMLGAGEMPAEERSTILEQLTVVGHPFRDLALEQKALMAVEAGEMEAALEIFQGLAVSETVSAAAQDRAVRMITALGGEIPLPGTDELPTATDG